MSGFGGAGCGGFADRLWNVAWKIGSEPKSPTQIHTVFLPTPPIGASTYLDLLIWRQAELKPAELADPLCRRIKQAVDGDVVVVEAALAEIDGQ